MIVNDIFKSYLSGMSINEIAEHLNTIYPKENSKWNPRTIHAILRNEKYSGIALYYFTYYYVYPYHLAFINFFHLFCLRIQHRLISKLRCFSIPMFAAKRIVLLHTLVTKV